MATSADITLDVSDFPSEIPCGKSHMSYVDKILAYRHGVLLVPGRDYLLGFEFTQDGVIVPEVDWCKTSNTITIKVTVMVKPEFGPTGIELSATPAEGPVNLSILATPAEGPSDVINAPAVPSAGPLNVTVLKSPASGPSDITLLKTPSSGPASVSTQAQPIFGPTTLTSNLELPYSGPANLSILTNPLEGPSSLTSELAVADDRYLLVHRGLDTRWLNNINTFNKAQAEAANTFGDLSMYGIYEKQADIPVYAYDAPMGAAGTILGYAPWWKRVRITDWQGNDQRLETNENMPYIAPYAETDETQSGSDHYWINYKLTSSDPAILNLHRGVTHLGDDHFQDNAYDGTHPYSNSPNVFNYLRLELIGYDYDDDWSQSSDGGSWTGNQNSGYRGTRELVHPAHHDNVNINTKYWIGQQDRDLHSQEGVKNISCYHVNLYSHDGFNGMPARNTAPYILPISPETGPSDVTSSVYSPEALVSPVGLSEAVAFVPRTSHYYTSFDQTTGHNTKAGFLYWKGTDSNGDEYHVYPKRMHPYYESYADHQNPELGLQVLPDSIAGPLPKFPAHEEPIDTPSGPMYPGIFTPPIDATAGTHAHEHLSGYNYTGHHISWADTAGHPCSAVLVNVQTREWIALWVYDNLHGSGGDPTHHTIFEDHPDLFWYNKGTTPYPITSIDNPNWALLAVEAPVFNTNSSWSNDQGPQLGMCVGFFQEEPYGNSGFWLKPSKHRCYVSDPSLHPFAGWPTQPPVEGPSNVTSDPIITLTVEFQDGYVNHPHQVSHPSENYEGVYNYVGYKTYGSESLETYEHSGFGAGNNYIIKKISGSLNHPDHAWGLYSKTSDSYGWGSGSEALIHRTDYTSPANPWDADWYHDMISWHKGSWVTEGS